MKINGGILTGALKLRAFERWNTDIGAANRLAIQGYSIGGKAMGALCAVYPSPALTKAAAFCEERVSVLQNMSLRDLALRNIKDVIWVLQIIGFNAAVMSVQKGADPKEEAKKLKFKMEYTSPSVFEHRGYTGDEVMKQDFRDMVTPSSMSKIIGRITEEIANEAFGRGAPDRKITQEIEQVRKDGSFMHAEAVVSIYRDKNGSPIGLHGVTRDITERKAMEQSLAESEKEMRERFDMLPIGIHVLDEEGNILYVNQHWLSMLAREHKDVIGKPITDFVLEGQKASVMERFSAKIKGREDEAPRRNGDRIYVSPTRGNVTVRTKDKRIIGKNGAPMMLTAMEDITELKMVENELKQLLSKMSERVRELDCLYNVLRLIESSKTLEDVFMGSLSHIREAFECPDQVSVRIDFGGQEYLTDGFDETPLRISVDIEVSQRKRGSIQVFYTKETAQMTADPFVKEEKFLVEALAREMSLAIEKHEIKERERVVELFEAFKRMKDHLSQKVQALTGYASMVEMSVDKIMNGSAGKPRTDDGLIETKIADLVPQKEQKELQKYAERVREMNQIIMDIFQMINSSTGFMRKMERRPLKINSLIEGVVRPLGSSRPAPTVSFRRDDLDSEIVSDEVAIFEAMKLFTEVAYSLASKRTDGIVDIIVSPEEDWVKIKISDNGRRINRLTMDILMNPYSVETIPEVYENHLKMSLGYNYIVANRGEVEIENLRNGGLELTIWLPVM